MDLKPSPMRVSFLPANGPNITPTARTRMPYPLYLSLSNTT